MTGLIELERLKITCIVGILPFERVEEQDVFVDLAMTVDFAAPSASEHIGDTVDYSAIAREVSELVRSGRFQLIETMVERIASHVLDAHALVERVRATVHKPAAVPQALDTRVSVERSRSDRHSA